LCRVAREWKAARECGEQGHPHALAPVDQELTFRVRAGMASAFVVKAKVPKRSLHAEKLADALSTSQASRRSGEPISRDMRQVQVGA